MQIVKSQFPNQESNPCHLHPRSTSPNHWAARKLPNLFFKKGQQPYTGEGNGNPLQYSCLENPMDRGAWRLQYMGSQRVRHNGSNFACTKHIKKKSSRHQTFQWLHKPTYDLKSPKSHPILFYSVINIYQVSTLQCWGYFTKQEKHLPSWTLQSAEGYR